jgi:leader peptidase (prepilin peptidase)/N-methyltransferase
MLLARSILPTVRLAPIGGGDVLVAGMIGAMAGWPGALFALAAGVVAGGIGATIVLVRRRDEAARVVPFGPFLCGGALLVFLVWF